MDVPPFSRLCDGRLRHLQRRSGFAPNRRIDLNVTARAAQELRSPTCRAIDHAVRIFTGAVMPQRCDAVVIQEDVRRDDANDRAAVAADARAPTCDRRGTTSRIGAVLADAGTQLGPFDLAWLDRVRTDRRSRCAAESALRCSRPATSCAAPAIHCAPGRSTTRTVSCLQQLLRGTPVEIEDLGILPDDPHDHRSDATHAAAMQHDVVMTSGGVSVGDADYVRDIVERLGRIEFWKIAIKPGKPLAYGRIGELSLLRPARQSGLDDRDVSDAGKPDPLDARPAFHTSRRCESLRR